MAMSDANGIPIGISTGSASPHEITLVEETIDSCFVHGHVEKLIGDGAYDSDPMDEKLLNERSIELIAPHKSNRKKMKTQDGRVFRRYKRRWKIERVFAWLQNFRRLVSRYEYKLQNFHGFVQLGVMKILLRHF